MDRDQRARVKGDRGIGRRAFVAGATAAVAAGPWIHGRAGAQARRPDELVLVEGIEPDTLDPQFGTTGPIGHLLGLLYNGLVRFDEQMNIRPDLATGWTLSEDQLTWTFALARGVKFADGRPMTARDVKFTFDRLLDEKTAAPRRSNYQTVIRDVQAPDDANIKITTKVPYPDLLPLIVDRAGYVLPADVVAKAGRDFGQRPMGTGAFMFERWVAGDFVSLVPNPHFHGPAPKMRRIVYRPVPEGGARVAMLQTGEADIVMRIPPEAIRALRADPNVQVMTKASTLFISYEMNNVKPPLNDRRVRQAINYAVDKERIVEKILYGAGEAANSPAHPGVEYRATFEPYRYDASRAKRLLAEAGHPNGFAINQWSPQGRYLKDREIAEAVQGYLKEVGIQARLQFHEWAPYLRTAAADPQTSDKGLYVFGRSSNFLDYHLWRLYHSSNVKSGGVGTSRNGYASPEVDRLLEKARVTFDARERGALYRRAQQLIWEDAPFLFLHAEGIVLGTRKNVEGVVVLSNQELQLAGVSKR